MADLDLPAFLMPLQAYIGDPPEMTLGADDSAQKVLSNVSMIGQEQTNWCWSAVTQAVRRWSGQQLSQTDLATAHIAYNGRPLTCAPPHHQESNSAACATDGSCAAICNDPHILSVVLRENKLFARYVSEGEAPRFSDIESCINADKPVPCRVQWSTGGGHFILVIGWTVDHTGTRLVHVLDPAGAAHGEAVPEQVIVFEQFIEAYTRSGNVGAIDYSYEVHT